MFDYQKNQRFTATIANGLEDEGARELTELGATDIQTGYRIIHFSASLYNLMKITVMNRLCSRILAPLANFPCSSEEDLYNYAFRNINWDKLISPDNTFSIFANVHNSNITHSRYAALKLKDAIADCFRNEYGQRPSVDRDNPDIEISLNIINNQAVISLDAGHGPLHKRGYRIRSVDAPLKENLAAALVRISGWDGNTPLYDPFCGSGTILAEAGLMYCRMPPSSLNNDWGFKFLPDFDKSDWEKLQTEIRSNIRPLPANLIFGSDISSTAVRITEENLSYLPFAEEIMVKRHDYIDKNIEHAFIICNPPYGVRLNEIEEVKDLLQRFGDFLKHQCQDSTAWILVGDKDLVPFIGLKPSRRIIIYNGDIECRFVEIKVRDFITKPVSRKEH